MSGDTSEWSSVPGIERAIVRTLVSELLDGAAQRPTEEVFAAVCDVMLGHFSLANARLCTRVAGHSRAFVWSRPSAAPERPAHLDAAPSFPIVTRAASATVSEERLGLTAGLYIESHRDLDGGDHALLTDVLRRLLCLPSAHFVERDAPRTEP